MLIPLSERIWYYEGESETDRPYLYYVRGDEKSAVIDAGNSERHVKSFYQALKKNKTHTGKGWNPTDVLSIDGKPRI